MTAIHGKVILRARGPLKLLPLVSTVIWNLSISSGQIKSDDIGLEPKSGATYQTDIAAGGTRAFFITLKANEFAQVTIDQKGIDLVTSIFGPDNKLIHKVDWRWIGAESASWLADSSGQYRIQMSARRRQGVPGHFVLTVSQVRFRSELDRKWMAAENASTGIKEDLDRRGVLSRLVGPVREALALWQELKYDPGIAQTLNVQGFLENESGKPLVALDSYREALALRTSKDLAGEAETLHNLAAVQSLTGQKDKARDLYLQALDLRRKGGDQEGIPMTLGNLGGVHLALGEVDESINILEETLGASQRIADSRLEAFARVNLGAVYASAGETEDALGHFQNAIALAKTAADRRSEAYVLHNLGKIYSDFGDYSRALASSERALELMRTIGDKRGEGAALVNLGATQYYEDNPRVAISYLDKALAIFRETKNRLLEGGALYHSSRAHYALGQIDTAIEINQEALDIAISLQDIRGQASALRHLAEMEYSKRDLTAALQHLDQSRILFKKIQNKDGEADVLLAVARIARDAGNRHSALSEIEAALNLIESQRVKVASSRLRGSYFSSKREYYDFYIDLLMRLDRHQAALEASERSRARLLLETIPLSRIGAGQTVNPALDSRKRRLHREVNRLARQLEAGALSEENLAAINKRIDSLLSELDDVQAQILKVDTRYRDLTSPAILRLAEIQRQLDPETLLLEYTLGEDRSFLWAVTSSSLATFPDLPPRAEIEHLVRHLYESVRARNPWQKTTAALLSEKLLGPVRDRLKTKRLVIVGEGALQFLPFAALPTPGDPRGSALITRYEIVNLPSISVLAALRREIQGRRRPPRTLAVFADPVYSPSDFRVVAAKPQDDFRGSSVFRRLVHSRHEARAILSLVAPAQSRPALDFDADLLAAKNPDLGSFRIIHFATHGLLDSTRPALSALVFSLVNRNGQEKEGFLRLHEIYNLRLPADLVVLSACHTAMGKEIRGEGLVSLARGFMYAGAPRLVASLWRVDDESTSELMKSFYQGLLGDARLSPAAALRHAQLRILRNPRWSEPYYWAAFLSLGEWQ